MTNISDILIDVDDLSDGELIELLAQHLKVMGEYSLADSIHAIKPEDTKDSGMRFWSGRVDGKVVACGALKELPAEQGEIKSMRTSGNYLRQGLAAKILKKIISEAIARGYTKVSLETGTHEAFFPAIELYKRFGFEECGPFANYQDDPYSVFFAKLL